MARRGRTSANNALLTVLACGATVENAARSAGISERTAYRRLEDEHFQQELRHLRLDMVQRTAGMLTAASLESVKTLLALQDSSHPGAVRLGAARAIVELAMKLREAAELAERIATLEEAQLQF